MEILIRQMVNIELALKHLFVKFVCTDDQEFKNYLSKGHLILLAKKMSYKLSNVQKNNLHRICVMRGGAKDHPIKVAQVIFCILLMLFF